MHSDGLNVNFNRMNELTKELYGYYCSRESCKELVNIFPQIYYFIIFNYILSLRDSMTMSELRKAMMEEIDDNSFMLKQLKDIKIQKFISHNAYTKKKFFEMKSNVKFLLDNNQFTYKMRNKLINFLK